jgi:hypothetical protein
MILHYRYLFVYRTPESEYEYYYSDDEEGAGEE